MSNDLERVKGPDGNRWYETPDGSAYPSVTTITGSDPEKKKKIAGWISSFESKEEAYHARNQKGLRGTLAHHRILDPISMRPQPLPEIDFDLVYDGLEEDVQTCEAMWEQLDYDYGDDPFVEERTVSHEHGYAGTADLLTDDGTVTDLKTSKQAFPSHKMQVAAYFHAIEEMQKFPDPVDAAIIVLNPDIDTNPSLTPTVHRLDRDDIDHWFGKFKTLLSNYHD